MQRAACPDGSRKIKGSRVGKGKRVMWRFPLEGNCAYRLMKGEERQTETKKGKQTGKEAVHSRKNKRVQEFICRVLLGSLVVYYGQSNMSAEY